MKRGDHASVAIPGEMIIFGGASESDYFNDVWKFQFSSNSWSLLHSGANNAPSIRSSHSLLLNNNDPTQLIAAFGKGRTDTSHCFTDRAFKVSDICNLAAQFSTGCLVI
jgi:hypothetical protein